MGAWNCSINGNDTAQDLISEYRAAFFYNDVETALEKIYEYANSHIYEDEVCDFVYSLADFMWKKGILTEDVKNEAIKLIDSEQGLEIWAESGEKTLEQRKKVLKNFKDKLLSPQPPKKKITIGLYMNPIFEQGDVVTFKLNIKDLDCSGYKDFDDSIKEKYDGKYIVLRKIFDDVSYSSSIEPNVKDIWAMFQIVPYLFNEEPTMERLAPLLNNDISFKEIISLESSLFYFKKRNYKLLGNNMNSVKDEEFYVNEYRKIPIANQVSMLNFSVNRPWYHADIEFIEKINEMKNRNEN